MDVDADGDIVQTAGATDSNSDSARVLASAEVSRNPNPQYYLQPWNYSVKI